MELRSRPGKWVVVMLAAAGFVTGCGTEGTHNGSRSDMTSSAGPPNEPSRYDGSHSPSGGPSGGAAPAEAKAPDQAGGPATAQP